MVIEVLKHWITHVVLLFFGAMGIILGAVIDHMVVFSIGSMIAGGMFLWVLWYSTAILGLLAGMGITSALLCTVAGGVWVGSILPSEFAMLAILGFAVWFVKKPVNP